MGEKVAIVTGASSGIGKTIVFYLLREGYTVFGLARRLDRMKDIEDNGARIIQVDITNEEHVECAVTHILEEKGRIDILINNAGFGLSGSIEEIDLLNARYQFEVNVFGLIRMTKLVLPTMRKQRSGIIINISSTAGKVSTPMGGWYNASKFSVEALSDAFRLELKPFGINVVIIEPGVIISEALSVNKVKSKIINEIPDYKEWNKALDNLVNVIGKKGSQADKIAKKIIKIVLSKNPRSRYAIPFDAKFFIVLNNLLPDKLMDNVKMYIFKRFGKINLKNFNKSTGYTSE